MRYAGVALLTSCGRQLRIPLVEIEPSLREAADREPCALDIRRDRLRADLLLELLQPFVRIALGCALGPMRSGNARLAPPARLGPVLQDPLAIAPSK
ncbi:MAG: hypothetical protein ABSF69_22110 [Polyangiaceae bacterium]